MEEHKAPLLEGLRLLPHSWRNDATNLSLIHQKSEFNPGAGLMGDPFSKQITGWPLFGLTLAQ